LQPPADNTPAPAIAPQALPTSPAEPADTVQMCKVTADALNVRVGPSPAAEVVGWLVRGDAVVIVGRSGEWLQTPGGWIHGKYCEEVSE
jgi:uncharacterized protein YgiM (DUF1202 family)